MRLPTSRSGMAATIAGAYVVNWPVMVAGAWLGYLVDRSSGAHLEWDGLGGLIYGGFAGLVVAHVGWGIVAARILRTRPAGTRRAVAGLFVGVPSTMIAVLAIALRSDAPSDTLPAIFFAASAIVPAVGAFWASGTIDADVA